LAIIRSRSTRPAVASLHFWSVLHVHAKITEIQASSKKSFDDAVKNGIARADKTLRNVTGAWVKSQKVKIEKGKIIEYRVLLKVTFVLQD
jgi:flavin-binding protein dodecin